jgi:mannitol-specific phosphotransferase system IIBC component
MIKTIINTVLFTVTVLSIVFSIFLNSILGLFGLVSTSLDTLNQLKDSQEIVETMKERNKSKKEKAPKRFARKASTRVAASAVAAATIGTAAVGYSGHSDHRFWFYSIT